VRVTIMAAALVLLGGWSTIGQESIPRALVVDRVDGARICVEYGRPVAQTRRMFGPQGSVGYGTVWRTGADRATTFATDSTLVFAGRRLPRGTYSLFTRPGERRWEIIFNHQHGQWGSLHQPHRDALVVAAVPVTSESVREQFTIFVDDVRTSTDGGVLTLEWGDTSVRVPFGVSSPGHTSLQFKAGCAPR
jgi:hypothetical protein